MADFSDVERCYELFCTARFPLPSEDDIRKGEAGMGRTLPEEYREFLRRFNGGLFKGLKISCSGSRHGTEIDYLHGIRASARNADFAELGTDVTAFDGNYYPVLVLPIGADPGNNWFLMNFYSDEEAGVISLHSICEGHAFVANSFLEMFDAVIWPTE